MSLRTNASVTVTLTKRSQAVVESDGDHVTLARPHADVINMAAAPLERLAVDEHHDRVGRFFPSTPCRKGSSLSSFRSLTYHTNRSNITILNKIYLT